MKKYVMSLINAMLRKDPSILPLEKTYWAFENGRPAALCMMQSFHVFSGLNAMGEIYEDRKQGITFFYANMAEGNHDSVFYGSIEIKHERIQGIELTILRSRADTGFAFYPKEIGIAGTEWTRPICDNEKASRKEQEALAAKLYKGEDLTSYVFDDTCLLMENGGCLIFALKGFTLPLFITMFLRSLGMGPFAGTQNAIVAQLCEYSERKDHVHIEGFLFSCTSFGIKVGGGIAATLVGWALSAGGYVGTASTQSSGALTAIILVFAGIPAILTIVNAALLSALKVEKANADLKSND